MATNDCIEISIIESNCGEIRKNTSEQPFNHIENMRRFRGYKEEDIEKSLHLNDAYNVRDGEGRVLINTGHPMEEPDIFLPPQIARCIKAHQIGGIRFMYDNIIGSLHKYSTTTGTGCILAHAMGLGKTLQVVSFCDIFLKYTHSKTVLCIMPINTIHNWIAEFNRWFPLDDDEVRPRGFDLYALNDSRKTESVRSRVINQWTKSGGILLIGYEMYRILTTTELSNKSQPNVEMYKALINPGADLVVCDEGHRIKNSNAEIAVALNEIRSLRRIVLTGFPLQNNLIEYWCMVNFVKPNYLGSKEEFSNTFEIPIQNGKYSDSSDENVKLMNYRSYILHTILRPIVQRRSNEVVEDALPKKHDYIIPLQMTLIQKQLYTAFEKEILSKSIQNLLIMFAVSSKIWNHPDILYDHLKKRSMVLEIDDKQTKIKNNELNFNWAEEGLKNYVPNVIENSTKMQVLLCIINESMRIGDKVLLFSQSLTTLDLIEKFLLADTSDITWKENCNYFRLDGSTSSKERDKLINEFNSNPNIHLFLISTRAGCMGINLVAANRVIILDISWNPCHDNQALYRVHRFNQTKECYIYRLVMDYSLEMSIYLRQVNKQAISARVVDHRNPDSVSSSKELSILYWCMQQAESEHLNVSNPQYEDVVLQKIFEKCSTLLTKRPFAHNDYLLHKEENKLSIQEKQSAMDEYEKTLNPSVVWITEEKWINQGITAEVVHLPEDRTVFTTLGNVIRMTKGQRVMKLNKNEKHYIQLENGEIYPVLS